MRATSDTLASLTFTENGSNVYEEFTGTWEKTVELTELPATLSLTIESSGGSSSVGCEIKSDGVSVKNSSSGAPATVSCSTTIS